MVGEVVEVVGDALRMPRIKSMEPMKSEATMIARPVHFSDPWCLVWAGIMSIFGPQMDFQSEGLPAC